jgi:hypothetical protein
MTESTHHNAVEAEMSCPTCHARQPWSDECRRCKCDLTLLRQFRLAAETQRRQCLRELSAGRPAAALVRASRFANLVGGAPATRLLAVCHLLCHDWSQASALAATIPLAGAPTP